MLAVAAEGQQALKSAAVASTRTSASPPILASSPTLGALCASDVDASGVQDVPGARASCMPLGCRVLLVAVRGWLDVLAGARSAVACTDVRRRRAAVRNGRVLPVSGGASAPRTPD